MDYKEKYENGVECIQEILGGAGDSIKVSILRKRLQPFFPELRESEDEKIRKELCDFLRDNMLHQDAQYFISWLEKQGEKKPADFSDIRTWKYIVDMVLTEKDGIGNYLDNPDTERIAKKLQEKYGNIEKQGEDILIEEIKRRKELYSQEKEKAVSSTEKLSLGGRIAMLEELCAFIDVKQGERKTTNKVEPKFKVGDWIIFNGLILHIDEVVNGYYRTTSRGDGIHNSYDWNIDNAARLWTIEDAKDGDVLTNGEIIVIFKQIVEPKYRQYIEAYIGLDLGCNIQVTSESWSLGIDKAMPATKEQRDLLFQKMKEEGYEWDSEKKELKKVEPKKLDADKVIEWLDKQACLGWLEDIEVEKVIEQFKKDFRL